MSPAKVDVSVTVVVLTIREGELVALVQRRLKEPYAGQDALPRGALVRGMSLADTAAALVAAATGISSAAAHLEQLGAYDLDQHSSPAMQVAYLAVAPHLGAGAPSTDDARWVPTSKLLASLDGLAYEGGPVLADGVQRIGDKLERQLLAAAFCPPEFTIGDLRGVYEAVWQVPLDPGNFHRKVTRLPGFLEPTGRTAMRTCGRPGQTYRAGTAQRLEPPFLRGDAAS